MSERYTADEMEAIERRLMAAHRHLVDAKNLPPDERCGCFHCRRVFRPRDIHRWHDDGPPGACPCCGIDAVIGHASGERITFEFLSLMHHYWFRNWTLHKRAILLPGEPLRERIRPDPGQ